MDDPRTEEMGNSSDLAALKLHQFWSCSRHTGKPKDSHVKKKKNCKTSRKKMVIVLGQEGFPKQDTKLNILARIYGFLLFSLLSGRIYKSTKKNRGWTTAVKEMLFTVYPFSPFEF